MFVSHDHVIIKHIYISVDRRGINKNVCEGHNIIVRVQIGIKNILCVVTHTHTKKLEF